MNITIVKRSGIKLPTEFMLKKCMLTCNKNLGFAYARNGTILVNKNLKTVDSFLSSWKVANITTDDSVIIHLCDNDNNFDPVPFTNKKELMKYDLVECKCSVWAHDGDLRYDDKIKTFNDFIAEIYEMNIDRFRNIVNMCFNDSKIAILHADKEVELFGTWHNDDGLLYSNYLYKKSSKKINKMLKRKKN